MSLRFLHTADLHLGAKFLSLGERADKQREKLKKAFEKIIDIAIEKKVDFVLIAGDLFDNLNPSESSINFVKGQLKRLPENSIPAVIIPGTHDRLEGGSVFKNTDLANIGGKIHIFNNPEINCYEIAELKTAFYANPNLLSKSHRSPLENLAKLPDAKYHIALAHGSYQIRGKSSDDDYPITDGDIRDSGMDYIALGHWHSFLDVSQGEVKACYCGAPELIALDQRNSGYVLFIELENGECEVEKIEVGNTFLSELTIDLSKIHSLEDLIKRISENKDPNLIQLVNLIGFRPESLFIDVGILQEELQNHFFHLIIEDHSILDIGELKAGEHPEDYILGRFIKKVKESDLLEDRKNEVLKYGIALLKGRNIL